LASVKKRLDVLLVERGLAESRSQAQALVLAGRVRGFSKAGTQVDDAEELELTERPRTSPGRPASISAPRPVVSPTACSSEVRRRSARSTSAGPSSTNGFGPIRG
jgi:ribosomal protein S4